jgi:hypothetical protein
VISFQENTMSKSAIFAKKALPATASKASIATLLGYPANTLACIRLTITTTAAAATIDKTSSASGVSDIPIASGNTVMEDFGGNPVDLSTIIVSTASVGAGEYFQVTGCMVERSLITEVLN